MRSAKMLFSLLLALGLAACSSAPPPSASPSSAPPLSAEPTATPLPQLVQIDLTKSNGSVSEDLAQWSARCTQDRAGEPLSSMPALAPFKAVVLGFNPKNEQWDFDQDFPALLNAAGEPKYLICVSKSWTQVATYGTAAGNIPGYREDWQIMIEDLATNVTYATQTFVGQDPPFSTTYQPANPPTEIVGNSPMDAALGLLSSKLSQSPSSTPLSVPFGYASMDFAPDSQSLYVPLADGYHAWDFAKDKQSPLSFHAPPASCGKNGRMIRTSFDGKYVVTDCYLGDSISTIEIWSAITFKMIGRYDVESYIVDQQFEVQDQQRIISADRTKVTTLDISTGDIQVTPLKLEGDVLWASGQAKFAITRSQSNGEYEIWNLAEQQIVNRFGNAGFEEMQLSRDGHLLVLEHAQGGVTIEVRDVQTMRPVIDVTAAPYSAYTLSPDSRLLAVLTKDEVDIIDLQTEHLMQTIQVENPGSSILFSPDGQYIALPVGSSYTDAAGYLNSPVKVAVFSSGLH